MRQHYGHTTFPERVWKETSPGKFTSRMATPEDKERRRAIAKILQPKNKIWEEEI